MSTDEIPDFHGPLEHMIERHLRGRDITDSRVLEAMRNVPRHRFVLPTQWDEAYDDNPLRIGCGQTISQPYVVAYMSQVLQIVPGMKVLEIGTGCGYQTAVLAELGANIWTIERHEALTEQAAELLEDLGYSEDVEFSVGDGTVGWPEEAPFDRIIVTAGSPTVPEALKAQLADNGRMIIPVGNTSQQLLIITRTGDSFVTNADMSVIFVKLIGEQGWAEE